jgi:gamma-glutamyltranspeptidase/glutathione hydrolase
VNVIDHGMNVHQAIDAPRLHHQWLPDAVSYERFGLASDVRAALEAKGHHFFDKPGFRGKGNFWGDVEAIMIDPSTGIRLGACDPRSADAFAVGY